MSFVKTFLCLMMFNVRLICLKIKLQIQQDCLYHCRDVDVFVAFLKKKTFCSVVIKKKYIYFCSEETKDAFKDRRCTDLSARSLLSC